MFLQTLPQELFHDMRAFRSRRMALNVKEDAEHYLIELNAPKRNKKDFDVKVTKDFLTIRLVNSSEENNYLYSEWMAFSGERTLKLPKDADTDKISAKYKGGVLSIKIGKNDVLKPKMIAIT